MKVLYNNQRGDKTNTHPEERRYHFIQEETRAHTQQLPHTLIRQYLPNITCTEKRCQEHNSNSVVDRKTPLSSANMGKYHHKTGFITRDIRQLPNKHTMGVKLQD